MKNRLFKGTDEDFVTIHDWRKIKGWRVFSDVVNTDDIVDLYFVRLEDFCTKEEYWVNDEFEDAAFTDPREIIEWYYDEHIDTEGRLWEEMIEIEED